MKARFYWTLGMVLVFGAVAWAQAARKRDVAPGAAKGPLVGAWRLAWLDEPGAGGKMKHITDAKGSLIYTPDGHVAVQVMFAQAETATANSPVTYALGGYEGSFGRYDVNEATHTVTHHVEGANVRALVGQDLPRRYRFSEGRLIIRSARPDEQWSVAWKR